MREDEDNGNTSHGILVYKTAWKTRVSWEKETQTKAKNLSQETQKEEEGNPMHNV